MLISAISNVNDLIYIDGDIKVVELVILLRAKGAGTFHSASQSKEGSVGFGTSQHPIFMKLLPDHLWHYR